MHLRGEFIFQFRKRKSHKRGARVPKLPVSALLTQTLMHLHLVSAVQHLIQ